MKNGWTHDFTFYAYKTKMSDTIPVTVCHAMHSNEWKYRLSYESNFAGDREWTNDFVFFAFLFDQDNILPLSVGSNSKHMTARVVEGVSAIIICLSTSSHSRHCKVRIQILCAILLV